RCSGTDVFARIAQRLGQWWHGRLRLGAIRAQNLHGRRTHLRVAVLQVIDEGGDRVVFGVGRLTTASRTEEESEKGKPAHGPHLRCRGCLTSTRAGLVAAECAGYPAARCHWPTSSE